MVGTVFDIKRFAVHDGPGIRTTIFPKGCVFSCPWCQNPEGINTDISLWYAENRCVHCHSCIEVCPSGALAVSETGTPHIVIDHGKCTRSGECVAVCPTGALEFDGTEMDSSEVVAEAQKDRVFYEESGGGVTIAGGDPFYQHAFNLEILERCHNGGIHTAVETNLFTTTDVLDAFAEVTGLFLADFKLWDTDLHRRYTGHDVERVKKNLAHLISRGARVRVRIPLIPGITATVENVRAIARYVRGLNGSVPIELINFNPLARHKYRRMNEPYQFEVYREPLPKEVLARLNSAIAEAGLDDRGEESIDRKGRYRIRRGTLNHP